MRRQYEDILVDYLEQDELEEFECQADYSIVKVKPDDVETHMLIKSKGFEFLDRTILASIQLLPVDASYDRLIRFPVDLFMNRETYTDDVYELAYQAFTEDRRFHLKDNYDLNLSSKIIRGYIDEFCRKGYAVIKCVYKGNLIGFIIIKDLGSGMCENVLGAVKPEYQSRGAAISLYCGMMKLLRERGYEKVYGRISTKNVNSLNLHIFLGNIRFLEPEETFVCRRR